MKIQDDDDDDDNDDDDDDLVLLVICYFIYNDILVNLCYEILSGLNCLVAWVEFQLVEQKFSSWKFRVEIDNIMMMMIKMIFWEGKEVVLKHGERKYENC